MNKLGVITYFITSGVLLFQSGCSLQSDVESLLEPDLYPPTLLEITPADSPEITILFDEPIKALDDEIELDSGDRAVLGVRDDNTLTLLPRGPLIPGRQYRASLGVEDLSGNSCRFILPFWGWNPRVPQLLINEFNPEGSGNNPDCIELFVLSQGNTAGVCLYYGTSRHYEYRYVLPEIEVKESEYLIIHCRREFLAEEISEHTDWTESGGKLSSDGAWDLWLPEDRGLSGANGILSLYNAPDGKIMDAVVYSDREPDPEDDNLGWTSRTYDAAADLFQMGAWRFSNESISPKEAISSHFTTGTRSLCRDSGSSDSDRDSDWHTVPTGEKSFGEKNTDEEYTPPP